MSLVSSNKPVKKKSGLVIYAKTDRDEVVNPRLVTLEELTKAIESIPKGQKINDPLSDVYSVSLSPGSVTISKSSPSSVGQRVENYKPRTAIKDWSKKSRSSMIARLASLDYSPLFVSLVKPPVMITLTYPANWQKLVPTAAEAKRHLQIFRKRYERHFKEKLYGLWKMEFQARQAVHFHIFCSPSVRGEELRNWLSTNWVEIVNETDLKEREKHLRAGTGVDVAFGFKATDSRAISSYFAKHNSPGQSAKEYQNRPPDLWLESGTVGRYWGYWNLQKLILTSEVSEDVAVFIARTLRRWHKSLTKPVTVTVWRVNQKTGEVTKRKVKRRIKRFRSSSGYLVVKDGSVIGELLSRAIEARFC